VINKVHSVNIKEVTKITEEVAKNEEVTEINTGEVPEINMDKAYAVSSKMQ
jgi:hypothetical protein